jgi:hypothetical protein
MLLDPGSFALDDFLVVHGRIYLYLAQVIPKFVISDDKCVGLASVRNTVRIVVILRWSFYHYSFLQQFVQGTDRVR